MDTLFNLDQFAKSLRLMKTDSDKTFRECAAEIGISAPTLTRLVNKTRPGMPDVETLYRCCRWMNISPSIFANNSSK